MSPFATFIHWVFPAHRYDSSANSQTGVIPMQILVVFLAIFVLCLPLYGQVASRQIDSAGMVASPLVTAQASSDHVRFTALTVGSRMRLEILSPTGETLFDSALRPGNLIEWGLANQQGSRVADGVYGCIVTVEELSGRVTYRRGLFRLADGKAVFDAPIPSELAAASVDSGEGTYSILSTYDRFPFAFVGHDGTDARIESTTGGLIFHAGRFYAGDAGQSPHMRLTPEGNLGIGVREPAAKVDVAGIIRASEGFQFSDGTVLRMEGGYPVLVTAISTPTLGKSESAGWAGNIWNRTVSSTPSNIGTVHLSLSGGNPSRILGQELPDNTFYGQSAGGNVNADGHWNAFFGAYAGQATSSGSGNSFFGNGAGFANSVGSSNTYIGHDSGFQSHGDWNTFVGRAAGPANQGFNNSFFGYQAGYSNTLAFNNSFFGTEAGYSNRDGIDNSFFGYRAGYSNTLGTINSFFGYQAGYSNTSGGGNSFFGMYAGRSNTSEHYNSFFGYNANGLPGIMYATAIGSNAKVTQSNSLVLGSIAGINEAIDSTNVGIGITAPERRFHVAETSTGTVRGVAFDQYSADQFASVFILRKSRNASPGFHSILQNGDALFNFTGQGSDGTKFVDVARIRMEIDGAPGVSDMPGRMTFWTTPDGAASTVERMRIDRLGNVGIGTTAPLERLHVVGNIRATGSIFSQPSPETEIPDYVFESGYNLMALSDLENFVASEKHLPDIPSASEIKEKGVNLPDFQMKLLQKIEELTLYALQQNKVVEAKDARISSLEGKNSVLEAKNNAIEARLVAIEEMLARQKDRQ
jgi:trimeric autotransporter adhesin